MMDSNQQAVDSYKEFLLDELENSPTVGVCLTDIKGVIRYANQAFANMAGYSRVEDLIGKNAQDGFANPEDRKSLIENIVKYGSLKNFELRLIKPNGESSMVQIQATLRNSIITGIITEITLQKEYQEALEEQRRRYQLATSASGMGIWDWNLHSNTVYFSTTWKNQVGYLSEEIPDEFESWQRLLHPDDYERVHKSLYAYLDHPGPFFEIEFRMLHKDGSYRWIRNRAASLIDSAGRPYRMLGVHTDITDTKLAQDQLLKLERAVVHSPVAIAITSKSGLIEFVNPKFCELTGYPEAEVIGQNTRILNSGHHKKSFFRVLWTTILSGKTWVGNFTNIRKDGSVFIEKASISPVLNAEGEITHFIKIAEDITAKNRMERELREAKAKAEVANIYKNNFLANMSHEIRTPMNGIIGFSELLKEVDLTEEEKVRYIKIINDNCSILLNLVDDIIDVSKIEANEIKLQKSQFSLRELILELGVFYRTYRNSINRSEVEIVTRIPDYPHHEFIETDHVRLRQILTNLINNSLKFCHSGFIEFGYNLVNDKYIQFYVKDTGIGIPPDKIGIIFERFRQTDESITRKYGGTGLGLSISQGLVGLLGGNIWVESKPGAGSVFSFRIPYNPVTIPEITPVILKNPAGNLNLKGLHFLVVEDVDYNFEYLREVLRRQGARVTRAITGYQAVSQVISHPPDLVLMDLQLPEMNGYDAIKQIWEHDPDMPIIAQTSYAYPNEIQRCYDIGCFDYLVKPIRLEELFTMISKYL